MPKTDSNKRLTLGILSNSLDNEYLIMIWAGVQAASSQIDATTLSFCRGEISSPDPLRRTRNSVHRLISAQNIDGLIIVPSITCRYMSMQETEVYFEQFNNIPMVSIGIHIKNIPSIVIDNKDGMKILTDHLIEIHGRRKFLFIEGIKNNIEAVQRFEAFKQSLDEHGISIDQDHIVRGEFFQQTAYSLVKELLDNKMDFDAIVAANDVMAIGAINALQEKNITIPDDVTVTGFDDINAAKNLISPLTTVRQPVYEMAKKAVDTLIKKINGYQVADVEVLKTTPVFRRSCGCLKYDIDMFTMSNLNIKRDLPADYDKIRENVLAEFKNCLSPYKTNEDLEFYENIMDSFLRTIQNDTNYDDFFILLNKTLNKTVLSSFDNTLWNNLFFVLRKDLLPYFIESPVVMSVIEGLIHQSRILINETSKQVEINSFGDLLEKTRVTQSILRDLVNTYDLNLLIDRMASELPRIGISSCYLSLFKNSGNDSNESILLLAYNKMGKINIDGNGYAFPTLEIVPKELIKLEERCDLIIESLVFEKEVFGFIAVEFNPHTKKEVIITVVNDLIKTAIKASLSIDEAAKKSFEIEKALDDLKKEHIKLEQMYDVLKENKEKLLISEKMASLGKLTAGIAHEMSTPLATARAALSDLNCLIEEYKASLSNPDVVKEDHLGITRDMKKNTDLAEKAIEKAAGFIKSIKSQTMDNNLRKKNKFNAIETVNESILLISHLLKKKSLSIEFNFSSDIIILYGLPGRFSQVITNLITNAIDAMEEKKGETIYINLSENDKQVILTVEDKGSGIPENILSKIFDPLFSTKPFGQGTGLGLAIVHEIVYGDFNGKIDVESIKNTGTKFTIVFEKNSGQETI